MTFHTKTTASMFLFLSLFVFQLILAVVFVACNPITDSCCSNDTGDDAHFCLQKSSKTSCCASLDITHEDSLPQKCYCGTENVHTDFVQPSRVIVSSVSYLSQIKLYIINLLSTFSSVNLLLSKQHQQTETPNIVLQCFIHKTWPTICIRC